MKTADHDESGVIVQHLFDILTKALNAEYKHLLPVGFTIHRIARYDPKLHKAPHLLLEKSINQKCEYIATLTSDTECLSHLGETVNDAVKVCIMKIESPTNGQ